MRLRVRAFAGLRERLGESEFDLTVPDGADVEAVLGAIEHRNPGVAPLLARTVAAVNMEYVTRSHPVSDGDEVALIPPVSGGAVETLRHFLVTAHPLDARAAADLVRRSGHGAVLTFEGVVRDNANGKATSYLEYEAYPELAERKMAQIGAEVQDRWGLDEIAIWHRTGRLEVGETSLLVVIGSAHRAEAFEAGRYCVDRVKQLVPVWKKEVGPDGSYWVEGSMVEAGDSA